ncbi:MAG: SIMPL domain-containing protein [Pseudomonadota bacterium]
MKFPMVLRPAIRSLAPLAILAALAAPAACAQISGPPSAQQPIMAAAHPNSIQPETTLAISASGEVRVEPDTAFVSLGVRSESATAEGAMAANRESMADVFAALRSAGLEDRDIQTSNFSLQPMYDYIDREDGRGNERVLRGYGVSNEVSAKISDLDDVGATLDAVVTAGGNTFNGIRFALEDDTAARDEARRMAMETALARADLYASAAGYRVARIVTMSERESRQGPQPMMEMAQARSMAMAVDTPIAGGEVGYTAQVNILFELAQ